MAMHAAWSGSRTASQLFDRQQHRFEASCIGVFADKIWDTNAGETALGKCIPLNPGLLHATHKCEAQR
jgi:hypothetical protein